ncbi:MAG: Calx-beta domain-containing protein, partial [Arcobacter sp.]|uniref:Calx-beta domain-containing protein n=1 Tax=Arcobacter sp. TaxID=1872629 RepID=UPI002A75F7D1
MATIAGSVKSLSSGIFHAKDENGNIRVLQEGDTIYENDTVFGDNGNSSSSKIEILLSGNDVIVLSEGQKQLIDSSLIETAFGTEELFFTREGLDLKADEHNSNADVVSDLRDAEFTNEQKDANDEGAFTDANNSDVTKEETAEGQEEAEDETAPTGEFQARDGNATDIVSDLRNAQFKARTQVFEDKSFFENESKDRLTSPGNIDRPEYTNPPVPTPTPPTPTPQPVVTPPVIETPTVIIGNLSVNDVSSYESEGFLVFTVSLDRSVASPVTFDYVTSPITATNNGIDYTDVRGTITILAGSKTVTIKVPITDDYISDNGETMKINISNVVGNANITKPQGIGTILDNPVNNPSNGTPGTPSEPGGYGEEDSVYAIITGATTVNEGNTTTYTVKLVDKDGNPVIVTKETEVTIKYTNVTTQDGDTELNNNNTLIVKIPANGSTNTFTVESIDDYFADNGEKYNVAITKVDTNEFENVVIGDKNGNNKDVTTTILDNPSTTDNPTVPTDPTNPNNPDDGINYGQEDTVYAIITGATTVNEGNTTTYTVKLVD